MSQVYRLCRLSFSNFVVFFTWPGKKRQEENNLNTKQDTPLLEVHHVLGSVSQRHYKSAYFHGFDVAPEVSLFVHRPVLQITDAQLP